MKKTSKLILIVAILLIVVIPVLTGCKSRLSVEYVDYNTKLESDGYYAVFEFKVMNNSDSSYNPLFEEYEFKFQTSEENWVGYGVVGIYLDSECEIEARRPDQFLVDSNSAQTFYVKAKISNQQVGFTKIKMTNNNNETSTINAK